MNGDPVTVTADEGDVANSVLGIGYDPEVLEREDADQDLSEAEAALGPVEPDLDALPGEGVDATPVPATGGADRGDVPGTAVGVGYEPQTLSNAQQLADLIDAEDSQLPAAAPGYAPTSDGMPGDLAAAGGSAAIEPPTGLTGWFKREPLVAALVLANAPIIATFVTSVTSNDQTLSILSGAATVTLNLFIGAARKAVTPVADPKVNQITPLVRASPGP